MQEDLIFGSFVLQPLMSKIKVLVLHRTFLAALSVKHVS